MSASLVLFKFIAKASLNAVAGGVGGDFAVDVLPEIARNIWTWWAKDRSEAQRKADVQALVQAPTAEVQRQVKEVVREVAGAVPVDNQLQLETYLNEIPCVVRQSLMRRDDPRGATIPSHMPLQKPDDLLPFLPRRLPRFKPGDRPLSNVDWELVKLLGVGGFGEVWKARNPYAPNLQAALKFCLDPAAREQLLKYEASVLARVMSQGERPGIVSLRHTYLSADPPCLEYEFIEGSDLAGAIHAHQAVKGPLTPDMATNIVLHLARAVGHVHKLSPSIVHRDLKPANVLVRMKGGKAEFLITDFGIGGVVSTQALEQTRRGTTSQPMLTSVKGAHTPLYASPEQKRGEPPDPRDDVHALGVIWYQLLVGDFSVGAPVGSAWKNTLTQRGLSEPLLKLLESCFETEAEHRPANAAILAERIVAVRDGGKIDRTSSELEQDMKDALEELRTKWDNRTYFERQGPTRIGTWQAAAQGKDAIAQWLLARCLQEGTGAQKDTQTALPWLRRAADSGLAVAQNDLGNCYYLGEGEEADGGEAFRLYTKAAAQGLMEAQISLGDCYYEGKGVEKDLAEAVRCYRQGAEAGWVRGQDSLAECYFEGCGVEQDYQQAITWYRKAADQGLATAQFNLGNCYDHGHGVEKNLDEATKWWRKAAEQGLATAQFAIGFYYYGGYGVEQDYPQAISWYRKAAIQGHAYSQLELGNCYKYGHGVKKNWGEAAKWYRLAAEQGNDDAQFAVGYCYEKGHGVELDLAQAGQWYRQAANQGHRRAKNALKRLQKGEKSEPSDKDESEDGEVSYYFLNTNYSNDPPDQEDMLQKHKASAYFDPWKYKIEQLSKGDIVFLYQSGVGVVAMGHASGKLKKAAYHGDPKDNDEEYFMTLEEFERIEPPVTAATIKEVTGTNYVFMHTMFAVDADAATALIEYIQKRSTDADPPGPKPIRETWLKVLRLLLQKGATSPDSAVKFFTFRVEAKAAGGIMYSYDDLSAAGLIEWLKREDEAGWFLCLTAAGRAALEAKSAC